MLFWYVNKSFNILSVLIPSKVNINWHHLPKQELCRGLSNFKETSKFENQLKYSLECLNLKGIFSRYMDFFNLNSYV